MYTQIPDVGIWLPGLNLSFSGGLSAFVLELRSLVPTFWF
jgi:hypothetical protein